jgi:Xaa-Pro aminopeptidase
MASTAALYGTASGQPPKFRSDYFGDVKEIADSERRVPSDQFPAPFSDQEYADRLAKCRKAMSNMRIDLLWAGWPDSMCYLHGYEITWYSPSRNPRAGTAVHVDHDKLIFLGGENAVFSAAKDKRAIRGQGGDGAVKAIADILKGEGWLKSGTVVGMEHRRYLPTPAMSRLFEAAFVSAGAKVVDGTDVIAAARLVKSPAEIAATEQASRIADIGIRAVADMLKPGVSSAEIYGAAYHAMMNVGGEATAIPQAVQPGKPQSTHLLPSRRQIQAGESFAFDLAGVYKRYHANLDRTFICGEPSRELVRMNAAAKEGLERFGQVARAGAKVSDVNKAMREFFTEKKIWQYHNFSGGYELGIALPPDWCGDFWFTIASEERDDRVFEANMVTNYENSFRQDDPQSKYQLMAFSRDTMVYTPTGARRLSAIPCDLIVIG